MTTPNQTNPPHRDSVMDDEEEEVTCGMPDDDDADERTVLDSPIEAQLIGKAPHDAVFLLIKALYGKEEFVNLLIKKGQYAVVVDPTCRVLFKQDQFRIARRDITEQGAPSPVGSYKKFSYEEHFDRYKQKKLSESFMEYHQVHNDLQLALSRLTLVDLMEFAKKECMNAIQHTTEAQAKLLVYPHLYKLFVLIARYEEQYIPFYSDHSL